MTPQTTAQRLTESFTDEKLKIIAKFGCCAFTALWIMGIDKDMESICILADEIGKGLDEECTVKWFDFFRNVSGRDIKVGFREIRKLTDLLDVKGRCAVRFNYNGKAHWVGVENGKVVYNSLIHSVCVEKGKPTTARIITFA